MQLDKVKTIIILTLVFSLVFTSAVYSDSKDGWKGYGLYNISDSKITIINEDVNIKLLNERLALDGEFLVRNHSSSVVKATLGIPVQGIDKISLVEKKSTIKWKKRSYGSLQNEFAIENRIPQEDYWYAFNLNLNPGETKLLNIKLEALQMQEEQASHTFTYLNDRKLGFSNQVEKTSLYIDIADFQPYNILALQGIDPGLIGAKGDIVLKSGAKDINTLAIKYTDVVNNAIKRLLTSVMYKPREIALSFQGKNYIKTSALCDEYLLNPNDTGISEEEILFIKGESLRRLQNYDKYLEIVEPMDYSKLYPSELRNKIYMDRMAIYLEQQNQEKLMNLYSQMEADASESTQILKKWIESSSVFGASQINKEDLFKQIQKEEQKIEQGKSQIEQLYIVAMQYKYTPIIIFITGLLLGWALGKISFKRKRKHSKYIYRM
jgi:hypothetical protein